MKQTLFAFFVGLISITIHAQPNGKYYSAGELQSKTEVQYGRFEFMMYSSDMSGTTSTFFMWKNGGEGTTSRWNELDIETFGKSPNEWQSNPIWEYYATDTKTKRWEGYHTTIPIANTWVKFTLEWTPNYIAWFNNGVEVRRIVKGENVPSNHFRYAQNPDSKDPVGYIADAMRMCFNHWSAVPGDWLGTFNPADLPSFQFVDWLTYQKWNGTGFDAVSIRQDFNSLTEVQTNYNISTHTIGESNATFQTANVGVVNGMLWLSVSGYNTARPPAGGEIPAASGVVVNTAPTINITAPVNGSSVTSGTNIAITANAADIAPGTVSSVSFYDGATLLGTDTTNPYSYTWTGAAVGTHTITAKATDNNGASTTSAGVTITVAAAPVVYNHVLPKKIEAEQFNTQAGLQTETTTDAGGGLNIGFTEVGDYLEYGIDVPATANYTVDFRVASLAGNAGFSVLVDGVTKITEVAVASTGGWQNWATVSNTLALTAGKHTLRLNVTKAGFNLNWMDFKQVIVNVAPTVGITAPVNGSSVTFGTNITLAANAADTAPGTVTSVSFYDGAALLGTDTTNPYTYTWAGAAVGTHTITAKATDNNGAVTTSTAVTITVNAVVVNDPLTASYFLMKDVLTADYMRPTLGSGTATITQYEEAAVPTFDSYQWEFKTATGGYYYIINKYTKNAIQPTNGSVAENTGLSQVAFSNQINDEVLWSITPSGDGNYWIKNKKSGLNIRPYNGTNGGQGTIAIVQNTLVVAYSSFKWSLTAVAAKTNAKIRATTEVSTDASNDVLSFYPNPARDFITLSKSSDWKLFNSLGMNVLSGSGTTIDVSNLSKGMYILNVKETTFKVLVN